VLAVVIVAVVLINSGGKVDQPGSNSHNQVLQEGSEVKTEDLIDDDVVLGDPAAQVTLVEFGDYQCTFCTKFFKETEPALISKYVETGQLKIVFRDLAINGRESVNAAYAAQCAREQDKFWEYHDRLFNERKGYNVGVFNQDNLERFAADLGLNVDEFRTCYSSEKTASEVNKDIRDAQRFGARGTPTFILNGQLVVGAQPLAFWESAIEQLLSVQ